MQYYRLNLKFIKCICHQVFAIEKISSILYASYIYWYKNKYLTQFFIIKQKVKVWANQTRWQNATYPEFGGYPAEVTNTTLEKNNITKSENDTHQYYNSTFNVDEKIGKSFWVNLDDHPDAQINHLLSKSHRRAAVSFISRVYNTRI